MEVFDDSVHGPWNRAQTVGRQMIERKSGVIVTAMIVDRPRTQPAYNDSRAAVHQPTEA
jgi:NAD(P)-dependent dehydrogenase (short-subunit alcohol dehydrogenase family)